MLKHCASARLFEAELGITGSVDRCAGPRRRDPVEFFTFRLGDPWAVGVLEIPALVKYQSDDQVFDLRPEGQRRFRDAVNPLLARRDPPLEMDETGTIVQRIPEPFRRLIEQPLPQDAPKREVVDRVNDATTHYRRREATAGDRRAAVRELADVLEFLRKDVKQHMLRKDQSDLFRIANEFALRHNKPETRNTRSSSPRTAALDATTKRPTREPSDLAAAPRRRQRPR